MILPPRSDSDASVANVLSAPFEGKIEQPVEIFDTTLREGEQTPGVVFSPEEKMELAAALDEVGVHWVSVGYPAVSAAEQRAARRITQAGFGFKTAALSRTVAGDIDAAVDAGVDAISLILGGSDSHLKDKLKLTEAQACQVLEDSLRRCAEQGVLGGFALEDFSRTPLERMLRLFRVAEDAGAYLFFLPDTIGVLTPTSTYRLFRLVKAVFPRTPLALHCHNDLGLALANTLAGLEAGADQAQVTVDGVGERCGNTPLEELLVVLRVKYGRDLGMRLDKLHRLSGLLHRLCGTEPAGQKPVTGKWTFTHESGLHVAGLLANREAYQPYPPEMVGRRHEILFGKHSGLAGVLHLARAAGIPLSKDGGKEVLARIKQEAERRHGAVPEERIVEWMRQEAGVEVGS